MTEVHGWYDVSEKSSSFFGWKSSFLDEVVEQFASTHMLQNQVSEHTKFKNYTISVAKKAYFGLYIWILLGKEITAILQCSKAIKRFDDTEKLLNHGAE